MACTCNSNDCVQLTLADGTVICECEITVPAQRCPEGCETIVDTQGYAKCKCLETKAPTLEKLKVPIELTDTTYFKDVSWTVSYDPKSKAWISFHDWHPELVFPSLNHFLTTKTIDNDVPYCPPGYTYDAVTNTCCQTLSGSLPAIVTWEDLPAIVSIDNTPCLLDVVISIDTSGSVGGPTSAVGSACVNFVNTCINTFAAEMNAGNIQVGLVSWSSSGTIVSLNGKTMSNDTSINYGNELIGAWFNGGTNVEVGLVKASQALDDTANSSLGDRSTQPNFKRVIILVTDTTTAPPANVGCTFQGIPNQEVYACFVGPGAPPDASVLSDISCNLPAFEFAMTPATSDTVATQIASGVCNNPPACNCPAGYTMIGSCNPDNPPICRKLECGCPPEPNPNIVYTTTGQCDDIYQVANPDYINTLPLICNYNYSDCVTPSFKRGSMWKHNVRCDLYANYYGVNYPWEIEFVETVGQTVNTIRSIEYQLESYIYKGNLAYGCGDRFHDLDFNFDHAIIHNTEQTSGLLTLNLSPKNNVPLITQYPIINTGDIDILYSKEENKFRFNQFFDITKDRGEFNSGVNQSIFITQLNGYIRDLNAANLDYNKSALQHKKFRHYWNKVILRKNVSGNRKMLLKLANTKINTSIR